MTMDAAMHRPTASEAAIINAVFEAIDGEHKVMLLNPDAPGYAVKKARLDGYSEALNAVTDAVAEALRGLGFPIEWVPEEPAAS